MALSPMIIPTTQPITHTSTPTPQQDSRFYFSRFSYSRLMSFPIFFSNLTTPTWSSTWLLSLRRMSSTLFLNSPMLETCQGKFVVILHQNFTSSYCANILSPKKLPSQPVGRKKLCKTLSYKKKLLVKCCWNRHLESFNNDLKSVFCLNGSNW